MIGKKLSPVLIELESAIIDHNHYLGTKPEYTQEAFRATIAIFMSAVMDKVWEVQQFDKMAMVDRSVMATKCGEDLRKFVKIYTGIDTFDLYK